MNKRDGFDDQLQEEGDENLSSLPNAVIETMEILKQSSTAMNMTVEEYLKLRSVKKSMYMRITSQEKYASRSLVYEFAVKISANTKIIQRLMNLYGYSLRMTEIDQLRY